MPRLLTIAGETFRYPENREPPGWGTDATDWAEAVTDFLQTIGAGVGDILETEATIANNTAVAADVTGLIFDPNDVRSAIFQFGIYRVTSTTEKVETGFGFVTCKPVAGTCALVVVGSNTSNVTLTITSNGQVQYVSDNQGGTGYDGTIRFSATAFEL